jgi:hypothetical protein
MTRTANGFVDHKKVTAALRRVQKQFPKDVVSISYRLGNDWSGEPSIYFEVVLTDEARRPPYLNLGSLASRLSLALYAEVQPDDFGLHSYSNFFSQAEYEARKEKSLA